MTEGTITDSQANNVTLTVYGGTVSATIFYDSKICLVNGVLSNVVKHNTQVYDMDASECGEYKLGAGILSLMLVLA
eukprot:CAMPEP_0114595944 /NCGR_PEP_ID=MMETSP0125-20121206/17877_1 /TAXON_ID=485358 ORGANISM="Aristerostoma sp., Strain ATCC 50986" /NCGR_SAMPLE_ID=MMETSP0125 /ASSEMBLY_ACC=CAM_ASM_000245 /LENGTH=75 /DNA_ID=CAMNT_0001798307 /DNA_START=145 /DNA_END=368 /DNA_ORIENTATION=-